MSPEPTLYSDIGHLTLDITVVEYDENGESKITYIEMEKLEACPSFTTLSNQKQDKILLNL